MLAQKYNYRLRQVANLMKRYQNVITNVPYSQDSAPISENSILEKLRQRFPKAASISVEDTSGGCGAMFNIHVETEEFKGLSVMKQHRMVYELLEDELKAIHGVHLQTKTTK